MGMGLLTVAPEHETLSKEEIWNVNFAAERGTDWIKPGTQN